MWTRFDSFERMQNLCGLNPKKLILGNYWNNFKWFAKLLFVAKQINMKHPDAVELFDQLPHKIKKNMQIVEKYY